jgi:hypothetical protein
LYRSQTVFEAIADLWNSPAFNPYAPPSECHSDYVTGTICFHNEIVDYSVATAQKVEDILASFRSDLIRIINNWERSGQGDGGIEAESQNDNLLVVEDDSTSSSSSSSSSLQIDDNDSTRRNIGVLRQRSARALNNRAAFLNGRPSYLLYFWEIADKYQLLQSTLQRLNNSTGASDASHAASISVRSASRSKDSQATILLPLIESIKDLAECQKKLAFDQLEERRYDREFEERHQMEQSNRQQEKELELTQRRQENYLKRKNELQDLSRKYRKSNAELLVHDPNFNRLSVYYQEEGKRIEDEILELENNQNE